MPPLQTIGALDEKKREALEKTWRKVGGQGRVAGLGNRQGEAAAMWWGGQQGIRGRAWASGTQWVS